METNYFDPVQTQLLKGVNLIEASAGTGKTYAIAMLVLRFVVEQGMTIDKVLVVTFTKAATEELKDRVRGRLAEAKRALDGHTAGIDCNVLDWLANLDIEPGAGQTTSGCGIAGYRSGRDFYHTRLLSACFTRTCAGKRAII